MKQVDQETIKELQQVEHDGVQELVEEKKDGFGRPTVVTQAVLVKLEQAFAMGCTDLEACFYANIGKSTLYNYQQANPDFVERKNILKAKPVLLARQTVMKGIAGHEIKDENGNTVKVVVAPDPNLAMRYLEKKMHSEFKDGVSADVSPVDALTRDKEFIDAWFVPVDENEFNKPLIEPTLKQEDEI